MIFYAAGFGHRIENTDFIYEIDNHLISYYFVIENRCQKNRFECLKFIKKEQNNDEDQKDGSDKRTRKRKKRTRRKRNS